MQIITIILLIIGIIAILFSHFYDNTNNLNQDKKNQDKNQDNFDQDYYDEYGARIDELNNKILEINEYGDFMINELDKKHKELLFLYQLINEKSKEIEKPEIKDVDEKEANEEITNEEITNEKVIKETEKINQKNSNYNQIIIEFSKKGYNIKEIARLLDIGQGEVNLVLELYEKGGKNEKG